MNVELKKNDRFIIYTSGTSEKPKGVIISNKAISANINAIYKDLQLQKKDKSIIFSPPAYAMGISQILTYMAAGCGIIFYRSGLKFPNKLIKKIKMHRISVLNISISAFRILQNYLKEHTLEIQILHIIKFLIFQLKQKKKICLILMVN